MGFAPDAHYSRTPCQFEGYSSFRPFLSLCITRTSPIGSGSDCEIDFAMYHRPGLPRPFAPALPQPTPACLQDSHFGCGLCSTHATQDSASRRVHETTLARAHGYYHSYCCCWRRRSSADARRLAVQQHKNVASGLSGSQPFLLWWAATRSGCPLDPPRRPRRCFRAG